MFRSLTDEQLAAKHDKRAWRGANGWRFLGMPEADEPGVKWPVVFAPRVECIPSRDPRPWHGMTGHGHWYRSAHRVQGQTFDPRPEYARPPVNRVLAQLRENAVLNETPVEDVDIWSALEDTAGDPESAAAYCGVTVAEIDHARKVLTRLAALA